MKEKNDNKTVLYVIIGLLVIVSIGLCVFFFTRKANNCIDVSSNQNFASEAVDYSLKNNKRICIDDENCSPVKIDWITTHRFPGVYVEKAVGNKVTMYFANDNLYFVEPDTRVTLEASKNIENIFVAGFGVDSYKDTLFVLLEDGSVQYLSLTNYSNGKQTKLETLEGVDDVIRFFNISSGVANAIAQRKDGKYYVLGDYINNIIK